MTGMQCLQDSALNRSHNKPIETSEIVDSMGILDTDCVCNSMFALSD